MKYRPEVDGLRAFAVVPVILFHVGLPSFSGGFIGVDIFFVISGFLIATLIFKDLEHGCFSFTEFYLRRARRLLPAIFFVMYTCTIVSLFVFHPSELIGFFESTIAVLLFVSNEYFWRQLGYFGESSETTLLLHAWSLSVEEQFYFFFPFIALFLRRFSNSTKLLALGLLTSLSFFASLILVERYPDPAFFSLVTRAWELGVGVTLAMLVLQKDGTENTLLAMIGFVGIIVSFFLFTPDTTHPGILTLIPVIATALVLFATRTKGIVGSILSFGPTVFIGKISYSLYLWHHPVLALFKRVNGSNQLSLALVLTALALTFSLAVTTYFFIEKPFRQRSYISTQKLVRFIAVTLPLLFAISVSGVLSDGFNKTISYLKFKGDENLITKYQLVNEAVQWHAFSMTPHRECHFHAVLPKDLNLSEIRRCAEANESASVIVGDSHALNLYKILAKSERPGFVIGLNWGGCQAHSETIACNHRYESYRTWITQNSAIISNVVYHQSGSHFIEASDGTTGTNASFNGEPYKIRNDYIDRTVDFLRLVQPSHDISVHWIGPFLEYQQDPLANFFNPVGARVNTHAEAIFVDLNGALESRTDAEALINYINWSDIFYEPVEAFEANCFLFRDFDHYSECGEQLIADRLQTDLNVALAE